MLFSLLLAIKTTLLCLFFLIVFKSFFSVPLLVEKTKSRLALAIPNWVPITVVNKKIETLTFALDKKLKTYQNK